MQGLRLSLGQVWAPRFYSPAIAFIGTKTTGVRIIGVDPEREARTTRLREKVRRGKFISGRPLREVAIGIGLVVMFFGDAFMRGINEGMIRSATDTFAGRGQIHARGSEIHLNSTLPRTSILTQGPLSAPAANRRRV